MSFVYLSGASLVIYSLKFTEKIFFRFQAKKLTFGSWSFVYFPINLHS